MISRLLSFIGLLRISGILLINTIAFIAGAVAETIIKTAATGLTNPPKIRVLFEIIACRTKDLLRSAKKLARIAFCVVISWNAVHHNATGRKKIRSPRSLLPANDAAILPPKSNINVIIIIK